MIIYFAITIILFCNNFERAATGFLVLSRHIKHRAIVVDGFFFGDRPYKSPKFDLHQPHFLLQQWSVDLFSGRSSSSQHAITKNLLISQWSRSARPKEICLGAKQKFGGKLSPRPHVATPAKIEKTFFKFVSVDFLSQV